ncbi:hypothetical protein HETIRDRAFT_419162 [Heterobasidion irregulare TC 32-1]|uniref:Uncharacterized protein n=1 Tax=Heterobasidion irregulare (strain TC 32-1) TaxID=747525 RepID=W4K2Y6_HETIT|nr:uncharacterized protein HETIRDRAFT_419162 [Heterobasidion irregulare TC 32-1]ETW79421.1 hypothetical protein HETIRDRAFT_419162 [Heterobasidion irregulare TC 32-1]
MPDARSYAHGLHVRKSIFGIFPVYALSRYSLISYRDIVCSCHGQCYALHRSKTVCVACQGSDFLVLVRCAPFVNVPLVKTLWSRIAHMRRVSRIDLFRYRIMPIVLDLHQRIRLR